MPARQKIAHIIATQDGEEDEQAPGSLQETKYWCVVMREKTEYEDYKYLA